MTKKDSSKEVDYRIACWLFENLKRRGAITEEEQILIQKKLLEKINPPLRCLETEVEDE